MQKWEYQKLVEYSFNSDAQLWSYRLNGTLREMPGESFTDVLNWFGQQGWEIVSAVQGDEGIVYVFKRPKTEKPTALKPIRS